MTGSEIARTLSEHVQTSTGMLTELRGLLAEVAAAEAEAKSKAVEAYRELAATYLPTLEPAAFEQVASLTGFRGFTRRDPLKVLEHERTIREHAITRVEADERYQRREWLVGAHGELTRALEEAASMLKPWHEEAQKYECLDRWQELIDTGYDTPEFSVSWLSPRYWKLWAAGDAVCEALSLDDFGDDVLPAFRKVDAERQKWRRQVEDARDKVHAVHELVRERDTALAEIPRLPERILEEAVVGLGEFLATADPGLLDSWIPEGHPDARAIRSHLRRAAGLDAKVRSLNQFKNEAILPQIAAIEERKAKHTRKIRKFRRAKHSGRRHLVANSDPAYPKKAAKYRKRVSGWRKLVRRIDGYDAYDQFSLDNDPELWWREFTGGRPPSQMGSLRSWYDRNPSARPTRAVGDAEAVAVASVVGRTSTHDAMDYLS